jgi:hypothetical protein
MTLEQEETPAWQVFCAYMAFIGMSAGFVALFFWLSAADLISFIDQLSATPKVINLRLNPVFLALFLPLVVAMPIAFFPPRWSSERSSEKRIILFVYLLGIALVMTAFTRLFAEDLLRSYLLPKGYVQCETERMGTRIMMKRFEFVLDETECKDGVRG